MLSQPYPKISVVTCVFNSEPFLRQALDSVEAQTYGNIEHILNYSPSTDGTLAILEAYMQRNQGRYPIKLVTSEPGVWGMRSTLPRHTPREM
jgi:glycosyltransferase involved in cell wall biosynthesis